MKICIWADGGWKSGDLLGGSEECVVYLAEEFAKLGHHVDIVNGAYDSRNGVRYLVYMTTSYDVIIVQRDWRKVIEARLKFPTATILLYCHDIPVDPHFPQSYMETVAILDAVDKVVLLNDYHRGIYKRVPDDKAAIIPIGVKQDYDLPTDIVRDPHRCLYFSHPGRGLHDLRSRWADIRRAVPTATLHAFWWEPQFFLPADEAQGIMPMRSLLPHEVPVEILKSGLFTYPCCFAPEISPATTLKAQIWGACPVTINQGGMCDTVRHGHAAESRSFTNAVINALNDAPFQESVRSRMMSDMSARHSWSVAAQSFLSLVSE